MRTPPKRTEVIFGRRPVLEALRSGHPLQRLLIVRGAHGPVIDEIFSLAREARIPYDLRDRGFLDRIAGEHHQGVIAYLAARSYADFDALLSSRLDRAFLVFLDGIQDPHNLGAIIRTAHAVGADGVVVQQRGAAGLTPAAVKASAGAVEHLPVCRIPNLRKGLQQARDAGLWIAGLDPGADTSFTEIDYRSPCAIVVGGEGKGLRRMVGETCDVRVRIPMHHTQIGSFNASVAAALVMYEVFRQRSSEFE